MRTARRSSMKIPYQLRPRDGVDLRRPDDRGARRVASRPTRSLRFASAAAPLRLAGSRSSLGAMGDPGCVAEDGAG
jgi:hypothetical protein